MGGNTFGSASPSVTNTSSQSSAPTGGKGSSAPVQPYQGGQQAQQSPMGGMLNWSSPNTDPSPFMQQQDQQQQNYGGAFGLGQTAQSAQQQQYNPNPQQMGIQGLMGGGYGKGGGGSMPNPYQPQQQGGMPMQQGGIEGSPSYDTFSNGMKGYTSPQMQQQMPQMRTMEARSEDAMPRQYQSNPSDPVLGFNPTQQSMQQGLPMQQLGQLNGLMDQPQTQQANPYSGAEGTLQKAQQQVMQQAPQQNAITQMQAQMQQQAQQAPSKNMFYNMSAADIDKYNASHMKKGGRVK
jgi:hypothetical protein